MAKDSGRDGHAGGSPQHGPPSGGPVPFSETDLSDEDLADIESLLSQKQDITRTDIPAQDFQSLLQRFSKSKGS
jgi:hypothetical protein